MLNSKIIFGSALLKIASFGMGGLFAFSAPIILTEQYNELIRLLSIITVSTVFASYGSSGFLMRNYNHAKEHDALNQLYRTVARIKIVIYCILTLVFAIFDMIWIAALIIMTDLSLIATIILYIKEQYFLKQLYMPIQAFIKLLFLYILNLDLIVYVTAFLLLPRIYLFKYLFTELKKIRLKRTGTLEDVKFVNNEGSTYISNTVFYFLLHSPILLQIGGQSDVAGISKFTFSFALFMMFYGLISTINELILPFALNLRNDGRQSRRLLLFSFPLGTLYFTGCAMIVAYLAIIKNSVYFHSITSAEIIWMAIFFTSTFILNCIRQYLFSMDKLRILLISFVLVMIATFFSFLFNILKLSEIVLLFPSAMIFCITPTILFRQL